MPVCWAALSGRVWRPKTLSSCCPVTVHGIHKTMLALNPARLGPSYDSLRSLLSVTMVKVCVFVYVRGHVCTRVTSLCSTVCLCRLQIVFGNIRVECVLLCVPKTMLQRAA